MGILTRLFLSKKKRAYQTTKHAFRKTAKSSMLKTVNGRTLRKARRGKIKGF